jgi:hypothetical protein
MGDSGKREVFGHNITCVLKKVKNSTICKELMK